MLNGLKALFSFWFIGIIVSYFSQKNINNKKNQKKVKFAVDMRNECSYKYLPTDMVKRNKRKAGCSGEMYNIVNITTTAI